MTTDVLRFSRYAYPPNALGYCGPDHPQQILEQVSAGEADHELRCLAQGFEGAWPYLELIAGANGIADPLDDRVVEAYWIGNGLLDRVGATLMGNSMEDRFKRRAGPAWKRLIEAVPAGAVPHHSFHVFGVYPWLGLLREGGRAEPLKVLDQCRIRWGQVIEIMGDRALVRSRPLAWDGRQLTVGPAKLEKAVLGMGGHSLAGMPAPGDWVSLHWDWVCERINAVQLINLRDYTMSQLACINSLAFSAPATVLS